jgi:Domain of unknown function (DUF4136)
LERSSYRVRPIAGWEGLECLPAPAWPVAKEEAMKMRRFRATIVALLYFSGLAMAQKVTYQHDRATDFSKDHTYKWVPIGNNSQISQITANNMVTLTNSVLAQRGPVPAASGQAPDVYVGFQASISQQQQLDWYNSGGPWNGSMGSATTYTIDTGTLVLEFYSPAQKHLIWRGIGTKTINRSSNPEKNYANLQKAVEKILKKFPPSEKK